MRIRDEYVKRIFEEFGFEFSKHSDNDLWECEEIDKHVDLGVGRQIFKYHEYEIIISKSKRVEGRWYYQRFNMGLEDMSGYSNSCREVIRKLFDGIRKYEEIGKYRYISKIRS